jgi:hypothetical protein
MRSGRCDSSPTEPAASKPANERNPNVDASASADSPAPSEACSYSRTPAPGISMI